jgi:hypothetical protein
VFRKSRLVCILLYFFCFRNFLPVEDSDTCPIN